MSPSYALRTPKIAFERHTNAIRTPGQNPFERHSYAFVRPIQQPPLYPPGVRTARRGRFGAPSRLEHTSLSGASTRRRSPGPDTQIEFRGFGPDGAARCVCH